MALPIIEREHPGRYPLEINVIQSDLIYQQAIKGRVNSSYYFGNLWLGSYDESGQDCLGKTGEAFLHYTQQNEDTGIQFAGVERIFNTRITFKAPTGFVSVAEGQQLVQELQRLGYHANYSRRAGSEENSVIGGISIRLGEYNISINLGFIGASEVQQAFQEAKKSDEKRPWSSEEDKKSTLDWYDRVIADPMQIVRDISVLVFSIPRGRAIPEMQIPLDSAARVEEVLRLNARVAQDFHELLNRIKGIVPTPKSLTIKPEVLGADERLAEEISRTNAPVRTEMALPAETGFEQIAGCEEEVENLKDIAFMLRTNDPNSPAGILLYGPPGTGKTVMAKAFARECRDFATFTPLEMGAIFTSYMHESANRLRRFLSEAQKRAYEEKKSLAIIFLDELDAVATSVGDIKDTVLTDDRREVRKVLLEWLDGIRNIRNPWDGIPVMMIGASNFKEMLDEALLRSGRMEEHIYLGEPKAEGLAKIMELKAAQVDYVDPDIDWEQLAKSLEGISGADVDALLRKAYRRVVVRSQRTGGTPRKVTQNDLQEVSPDIIASRNRLKTEIKRRVGFPIPNSR